MQKYTHIDTRVCTLRYTHAHIHSQNVILQFWVGLNVVLGLQVGHTGILPIKGHLFLPLQFSPSLSLIYPFFS